MDSATVGAGVRKPFNSTIHVVTYGVVSDGIAWTAYEYPGSVVARCIVVFNSEILRALASQEDSALMISPYLVV